MCAWILNDFFHAVRSFLLEYLPNQRCFSENTVRSYRQALNLFILYLRTEQKLTIRQIRFDTLNREMILNFLDWLETDRHCCASTRNQRLMVLRSFFDYVGMLDCSQIALGVAVQNVPLKAAQGKVVEYLSEHTLESLLKQPNPAKRTELRNLFFMVLMYDTAARCGELLSMKVRDLRLKVQYPVAYLHGKGNKTQSWNALKAVGVIQAVFHFAARGFRTTDESCEILCGVWLKQFPHDADI